MRLIPQRSLKDVRKAILGKKLTGSCIELFELLHEELNSIVLFYIQTHDTGTGSYSRRSGVQE